MRTGAEGKNFSGGENFVVTDSRDCYKKLAPKGETITKQSFR
ncbi:MAG: hypothetical protein ACLUQB_13630 [Lachnospiraceae bacterium]